MAGKTITISEARRTLPALIAQVARTGVPVTITRHDEVVARIVPVQADVSDDLPLRGHPLEIADDFDEPLGDLWEAAHS
jgi:prevent-host-death family protein